MRSVLVGEVRTAEHALLGLLGAGEPPVAIFTTDVNQVRRRSGMGPDYYCDLVALGETQGIEAHVVADLEQVSERVRALEPDLLWIMGWPYLVRRPVLELSLCVGMHPAPLPRRRGGAPMNWTILDGETSSAVTLFRMGPGIDDGDILAQRAFAISEADYVADVARRVYELTEKLVGESVARLRDRRARWLPQDHSKATYTRRRRPADGHIAWDDSSVRVRNLVRATSRPFPGAFSKLGDKVVRIWRAELPLGYRAPLRAAPGSIIEATDRGAIVSTGDNALLVTEVQFEGEPAAISREAGSRLAEHTGDKFGELSHNCPNPPTSKH